MKRSLVCLILALVCVAGSATRSAAQLVADFEADTIQGCVPLVITFKDKSSGNPVAWKWDLGNGTVSFKKDPSTTYFNPGQYTITLTIEDASGRVDSVTRTQMITSYAIPLAEFSASETSGCFPKNVTFKDESRPGSGNIEHWEWDFGDGSTSTGQHPAHLYTAMGTYNVTLRVKNSFGCVTTLSKPRYIQLPNGVNAGFNYTAPNSCRPPSVIKFQNQTTGTGTIRYRWTFGDGTVSTDKDPSHSFNAAGSYTVSLAVENNFGCRDVEERINAINIGTISAGFTAPDEICAGKSFNIVNTSAPSPAAASWDFGDGTLSTDLHPAKIYDRPGTYTIRLLSDFGACKDASSRVVRVLPKPVPAFSATDNVNCKVPLNVTFTNASANAVGYEWLFGDGSSSREKNPRHTYLQPGRYDVTLIITGTNGCSDTLTRPEFVNISSPSINIQNLPLEGCVPLSFTPAVVLESPQPLRTYRWDFGDGGTSAEAAPTHIYSVPGVYTVKLYYTTVGGCSDSVSFFNSVKAGVKPKVNFEVSPRDACAFESVAFTDLSTGNPLTEWLWEFGDLGTSTEANPTHLYNDTGYFTVTLTVSSNGCKSALTRSNYVHISPPIAAFSDSSGCGDRFSHKFTDESIGARSWNWNFGDGSSSQDQNPSHRYSLPGLYVVSLQVSNGTCAHSISQEVLIIDEKADFSSSDTVACKNAPVVFTTEGLNPDHISQRLWLFGDGTSSPQPDSVLHAYNASGRYDVQLVIRDIMGCTDTLEKPAYIRVEGPTADFSSSQSSACRETPVTFKDLSVADGIHPITEWQWSYGDGSSEVLNKPPFSHRYADGGVYSVSLKVTDSNGCTDSIRKDGGIFISRPLAAFISPDSLSCEAAPIQFLNQSSGTLLQHSWLFGDGSGRFTEAEPVHRYSKEGDFTVQLVVRDEYGCTDSLTRSGYVRIHNPRSAFSVNDSVVTCPPLVTTFTNHSENFVAYEWDFGDGTRASIDNPTHFYNSSGTYLAKLIVTSMGGCKDSVGKNLVVRGPQGEMSYDKVSGCSPVSVNFRLKTKDKASFIWDFNDGSITNTPDSTIAHTYTIKGSYVPRIILVDPQGCKVPLAGKDTIHVLAAEAGFLSDRLNLCDSGFVQLTDSSGSNDSIVAYNWSFGDGKFSNQKDPSHYYTAAGNYPIRLTVTTRAGCRDSSDAPLAITVDRSPMIAIDGDSAACAPAILQFSPRLLRTDTSALQWNWDLGNGDVSFSDIPPGTSYPQAANITVQAIARNERGCSDTAYREIAIHPRPVADAGADATICVGSDHVLQGTGEKYLWAPAATLSCSTCSSPVFSGDSTTQLTLTTENMFGCSSKDSVIITVKQPFTMQASPSDTLCAGESLRLFAKGAEAYSWTPSTGLDDPGSPGPRANPGTTTTYQVVGRDSANCFFDTAYVPITVYSYPVVNAGEDKTIALGSSISLTPSLSADVNSIRWEPASSLSCSNCPQPVAQPKLTTSYAVEVSNEGGCSARDEMKVTVVCKEDNLFMPNTFSPNGDGVNDVFYPRGKEIYGVKSFRIFNRWGELVFEKYQIQANDMRAGWDGRFKGKDGGQDVYVYLVEVVCENNAVLMFKGNVTLIR